MTGPRNAFKLRLWILVFAFFQTLAKAFSASATLEWDPNTEADLAGYRVRVGTAAGQPFRAVDAGNVTRASVGELSDGTTYYFSVVAYNSAGLESSPSNEVTYTPSGTANQPPAATLISPTSGQTFVAPASITVEATAADPDGSVARVEFYAGADKIGEAVSSPYRFVWANVSPGSYQVTAMPVDNSGATASSAAVLVQVAQPANQAPLIAFTAPAAGTVINAPATSTLAVNVSDPDGTVVRVQFYANGLLVSEKTVAPFTAVWNQASAGNYVLTATATDDRGATATTAPLNVVVNAAPSVALSSAGTSFTAPATISLSATATDADGSIARVDFYQGATKLGSSTAAPFAFAWSNVAAGNYTLTAVAVDNAGATTTSAPLTVTVAPSNQAPTVAFTSPANNADFAAPANITLAASAADADGTVAKVRFYNGGVLLGEDATAPYAFNWTGVSPGRYAVTATAVDDKGATTTTGTLNVNVGSAPVIALSTYGTTFSSSATIVMTAAVSDADDAIARVDFFDGATKLGRKTNAPYTFSYLSPSVGSHTLTAVAYDRSGLSTTSAPVTVQVAGANQLPTISFTLPAAGAVFQAPATIAFSVTAADPDGAVVRVDFFDGATKIGQATSAPFGFLWNAPAVGNHSITATAVDDRGGTASTAPLAVIVNAPPAVALSVDGGPFTAPASIPLVAVASDSDGTVARVEFYHGTTKLAEKVTAPFTYTWSSVSAGSYELRAVATDNRGATTTSSVATVAVAPANQAPVISITSPAPGDQFLSGDPVPITVSTSDADGTVVRVDYFAGSTLIGSTGSAPFAWTWQNPTAGSVSLTAVATDDRGATSVSPAVAVLVLSDPIAVVSDVSETSTAGAATFTASLVETGRPLRRVEFWADTMLLGKDSAANYQFTWNNPPVGTYGITAVAIDLAGNRYRSKPVTLVVSSMGPAAAAALPANLPATRATGINTYGELELQVTGRAREIYDVWRSDDLKTWTLMYSVWNAEGSIVVEDEMAVPGQFYRFSPH